MVPNSSPPWLYSAISPSPPGRIVFSNLPGLFGMKKWPSGPRAGLPFASVAKKAGAPFLPDGKYFSIRLDVAFRA